MAQYESFHLWGEGRFCYDDEKVNRSKDLIKEAEKALDSTKENITKGFTALLSVANIEQSGLAENIRTNEPIISKFPEECVTYMEELYKMVNSKQEEIETYKNASGWDKFWSTVGMAGSKFLEGIASVGENIVDAGATLVGCVGGLFDSDFQKSCADFIKKDHVGEAFHNFNEATGLTKYSAMSEYGTAAKIFKGVGTITGYAILGGLTGGALGVSGTTANTIVAATAGLGSGMEEGLNETDGDWNRALGGAVKQAVVQGGTAYAMGKFAEKVQTSRAMKANGGKNADIVEQANNNVKASKQALSKARHDYAMNNSSPDTKLALKNAKANVRAAENIKQYVEKESISGKVFLDNSALNHTTSESFLYNAGEKLGEGASKIGEGANKVATKIPGVKTVEKIAEKGRSIGADLGTKAGNLTNKIADKTVGKLVDSGADKVGTLLDKGARVVDKIDDAGSAIASKIPGSQAVSNFAQNHKVLTAVAKLPGEAASATIKTAATQVVKSPGILASVGNEIKTIDRQVDHNIEVTRQNLEAVARNTVGKEDISYNGILDTNGDYSTSPAARDDGYVEPTTPGYTNTTSTSDSGYTAYQPSVAARQVSSSGGGYTATSYSTGGGYTSSSGGSSYTPTYTATSTSIPSVENVEPVGNLSPTSNTSSNTYTTPSTTSTTSTSRTTSSSSGSTGNSNAVIDTFKNTSSGTTSSGSSTSSYSYEEPVRSTTTYSSSGTAHSGGGYSSSGYSFGGSDVGSYSDTATSIDPTDLITEDASMTSTSGTLASSITSTNKFSNQTIKIPTSSESVTSSSSNMAIPTAAAFSAAAAAGIGAKAYMDKKEKDKENTEEAFDDGNENSGFSSDSWDGNEDDIRVDYGTEEDETLDDDNSYSADSIIERYEAVSNDELEEA